MASTPTLPVRQPIADGRGCLIAHPSIGDRLPSIAPKDHATVRHLGRTFEIAKGPDGEFLYQPHLDGAPLQPLLVVPSPIHGNAWWVYDLVRFALHRQAERAVGPADPFDTFR